MTTRDKAMTTRDALIEAMARAIWPSFQSDFQRHAVRDALAALEAAGVRMVPVEATEGMLSRGSDICYDAYADEHQADEAKIYTAMIAASPYAPKET